MVVNNNLSMRHKNIAILGERCFTTTFISKAKTDTNHTPPTDSIPTTIQNSNLVQNTTGGENTNPLQNTTEDVNINPVETTNQVGSTSQDDSSSEENRQIDQVRAILNVHPWRDDVDNNHPTLDPNEQIDSSESSNSWTTGDYEPFYDPTQEEGYIEPYYGENPDNGENNEESNPNDEQSNENNEENNEESNPNNEETNEDIGLKGKRAHSEDSEEAKLENKKPRKNGPGDDESGNDGPSGGMGSGGPNNGPSGGNSSPPNSGENNPRLIVSHQEDNSSNSLTIWDHALVYLFSSLDMICTGIDISINTQVI